MIDALRFQLAQEELIFLLQSMHEANLPGLNDHFVRQLDKDHRDLAFAVADRTLRARGLLSAITADDRFIEPSLAGVLHDAAQPQQILVLRARTKTQTKVVYCSITSKILVERSEVEPGIHQFVAVSGRTDAVALLTGYLSVGQGKTEGPFAEITPADWHALLSLVASDPQQALHGMQRLLAAPLTEALWRSLTSTLVRYEVVPKTPDFVDTPPLFLLIQSEQDMLLIKEASQSVQITPTDAPQALALLREELASLLVIKETVA